MLEERLKIRTKVEDSRAATTLPNKLPDVTLRQEFWICGQIAEADQTKCPIQASLTRQSGQDKGHSEAEIIEAVICAVCPGLLREMLKITRGLILPTLKTILRGHFKVDSYSDLLHRLMNISQDLKESAQNFLLWKSSDEHEGPEVIQRTFLHSVDTGLLCDAVKFQLKPYLSNPSVTDAVLIERVNEAVNLEQ